MPLKCPPYLFLSYWLRHVCIGRRLMWHNRHRDRLNFRKWNIMIKPLTWHSMHRSASLCSYFLPGFLLSWSLFYFYWFKGNISLYYIYVCTIIFNEAWALVRSLLSFCIYSLYHLIKMVFLFSSPCFFFRFKCFGYCC